MIENLPLDPVADRPARPPVIDESADRGSVFWNCSLAQSSSGVPLMAPDVNHLFD